MKSTFTAAMRRAALSTRAGNLAEAMRTIQGALGAGRGEGEGAAEASDLPSEPAPGRWPNQRVLLLPKAEPPGGRMGHRASGAGVATSPAARAWRV